MLFNSIAFIVFFFPIVTTAYFVLPHRYRWIMLLGASCYFYMAFIPVYILILLLTITIDYVAARLIQNAVNPRRKLYLILSIVANVGVLAVFKYFDFLQDNVAALAEFLHWNYPGIDLAIILPIGLSFHTFQSLSYTIEVYYGRWPAERHFGIFALYVMFYPQLVAGPIERPQNLLPQFREHHAFEYSRVTDGLRLMLWGLFKKVVIADRLAVVVNQVFAKPTEYQGPTLIVATVFFAYQIYCDFSGYTDIARGAARVMGFRMMENFRGPYWSASVAEFWRRWHISLSTWFRDYVYVPLGGNRVDRLQRGINILVVFLLSGLWHGANWTFVIWGALHGSFILMGAATRRLRTALLRLVGIERDPVLSRILKVCCTFALVSFAWIFFRAATLADAAYVSTHLLTGVPDFFSRVPAQSFEATITELKLGLTPWQFVGAVSSILFLEMAYLLQQRVNVSEMLYRRPIWLRWAFYYAAVYFIVLMGRSTTNEFIYFQF